MSRGPKAPSMWWTWGGSWYAWVMNADTRRPVMHTAGVTWRVTACGIALYRNPDMFEGPRYQARLPVKHALAFCRPCRACVRACGETP